VLLKIKIFWGVMLCYLAPHRRRYEPFRNCCTSQFKDCENSYTFLE